MERIIVSFNKYYGWILALSIIGLVGGGLAALVALVSMFAGAYFALIAVVALIFIGILIIFPAVLLLKFCSRVKEAGLTQSAENIEQACRYQSMYIIFNGVLALIGVVLMLLGMIGGAAVGLMG